MTGHKNLDRLITTAKCLAAIVPIWWIFSRIHLVDLAAAVASTAWWTFPVVTVAGLLLMFLQGTRWWLLIRAFDPALSLRKALHYHFVSLFYSIALPTSYAQDVLRSVMLSRESDYSVVWGATWICRLLGLVILIAFSLVGITVVDPSLVSRDVSRIVAVTTVLLIAGLVVSFSKRFTRPVRRGMTRFIPRRLLRIPEAVRDGIYAYRNKRREFAAVLIMTGVMQVIAILNASLIIKGISGRFYLAETLAFIPLIEIISISLPLTPNGIGVREGLTAVMFSRVGLSNEDLGVYVLAGLYLIVLRIVGALPIFLRRFPKKVS